MNGPITSCKELNPRISSPSKLEDDCTEFLKGKSDPEIDQVPIFIEDRHWVKFSRCKPCLSIKNIQGVQIDS